MGRIKCRATYFRAPFISPRFIRQPSEACSTAPRRGEGQGAAPKTTLRSGREALSRVSRSPRVSRSAHRPVAQGEMQTTPRPSPCKKQIPPEPRVLASWGCRGPRGSVRGPLVLLSSELGTKGETQRRARHARWGGSRGRPRAPWYKRREGSSWPPHEPGSPCARGPSRRLETDRVPAVLLLGRPRASSVPLTRPRDTRL